MLPYLTMDDLRDVTAGRGRIFVIRTSSPAPIHDGNGEGVDRLGQGKEFIFPWEGGTYTFWHI